MDTIRMIYGAPDYEEIDFKPSDLDGAAYHGLLGMCEMEMATERFVVLCRARDDSWGWPVRYADFQSEPEQNGFLQMIAYGWLLPAYVKSVFYLSPKLLERLRERTKTRTEIAS